MGANLYWQPTPPSTWEVVDGARPVLRDAILTRFRASHGETVTLNAKHLDWLHGLADGRVDGAALLLRLLEEHESIDLKIEG